MLRDIQSYAHVGVIPALAYSLEIPSAGDDLLYNIRPGPKRPVIGGKCCEPDAKVVLNFVHSYVVTSFRGLALVKGNPFLDVLNITLPVPHLFLLLEFYSFAVA
jgi:hypothetical protein